LPSNITIAYTALSLSVPERVHFRYRLEGFDKDWQDVGTRRAAYYTKLSPGQYRFQVLASNNDGVWNQAGAVIDDLNVAAALHVLVEGQPRNLHPMVRDNGCGIDPQILDLGRPAHWGLAGMRERAQKLGAKLAISSRPGAGTEVVLYIPASIGYRTSLVSRWRWSRSFASTESE
jgi:hypothetical protein